MKKITLLLFSLLALTLNAQVTVFTDDFEAETVDAVTYTNWISTDDDADGNFWEVADVNASGLGLSLLVGLMVDSDSWEANVPFSPNNYLTTTNPLDLTNIGSTMLTYTVGTYQTSGAFIADQYSIYLTTSNAVVDINAATPVTTRLVSDDVAADSGDGANSASVVNIDVSMYDGQIVYLTFRHFGTFDENSVLIDDVTVEGIVLSVEEFELNQITHTFNQDSKILTLESQKVLKSISIYNILGQETLKVDLNNTRSELNLSTLQAGIYIAKIIGNNNATKTIKLVIK